MGQKLRYIKASCTGVFWFRYFGEVDSISWLLFRLEKNLSSNYYSCGGGGGGGWGEGLGGVKGGVGDGREGMGECRGDTFLTDIFLSFLLHVQQDKKHTNSQVKNFNAVHIQYKI